MENNNPQHPKREELFNRLAINTIRLGAIDNTVRAVRLNLEQVAELAILPAKAIVRTFNFSRLALRVAAVLLVLVSSAAVYKYATVNSFSLYNKQFKSYELGTTRGESKPDLQAFSYQNANWLDVVAMNNIATVKTNKSLFLAGMAQMELKQCPAALDLFKEVLANKTDDSFRDDAEYYSALGYLANHQEKQSLELIKQIMTNPDHKYYVLVHNMSPLDLKIVDIKK